MSLQERQTGEKCTLDWEATHGGELVCARGKFLNLSGPQFSLMENEVDNNGVYLAGSK